MKKKKWGKKGTKCGEKLTSQEKNGRRTKLNQAFTEIGKMVIQFHECVERGGYSCL